MYFAHYHITTAISLQQYHYGHFLFIDENTLRKELIYAERAPTVAPRPLRPLGLSAYKMLFQKSSYFNVVVTK